MDRTIGTSKTALLVIDMQNGFIEHGAPLEVKGVRDGLAPLKKFIDECREKGITIFYTQYYHNPGESPVEAEHFPELENGDLRQGSHGFEIVPELAPMPGDITIAKRRYDAFYDTNLEDRLRSRNITDIIIAGTMTDICCESTARSAMYRDFHIWFLRDLTFTSDPAAQARSLEVIHSHFGRVIDSGELLTKI